MRLSQPTACTSPAAAVETAISSRWRGIDVPTWGAASCLASQRLRQSWLREKADGSKAAAVAGKAKTAASPPSAFDADITPSPAPRPPTSENRYGETLASTQLFAAPRRSTPPANKLPGPRLHSEKQGGSKMLVVAKESCHLPLRVVKLQTVTGHRRADW